LLDSRHHLRVRPTKKPDVFVTPGFGSQSDLMAKCHKRSGSAGELPSSDRHRIAINAYCRFANSELNRFAQ
jgi:hypothetical protein